MISSAQFNTKTPLVRRLQESWAKRPMDLDGGSDHRRGGAILDEHLNLRVLNASVVNERPVAPRRTIHRTPPVLDCRPHARSPEDPHERAPLDPSDGR